MPQDSTLDMESSVGEETLDRKPALSPRAEEGRFAAVNALAEPIGRRMVAAFLGRDDYRKGQVRLPATLANLFMECLPRFVSSLGGEVALVGRIVEHGQFINASEEHAVIDGKTRTYITDGYCFIHLPAARVVVSADTLTMGCGSGEEISRRRLTVRCDRGNDDFEQGWREFTRRDNFLRGRAFFADGEIFAPLRRYAWDDVLLADDVKRTIRTHVEGYLANRERLKSLGVKARRGIILEGPPGTGKTLLGKVLADTLGCSFLWATPKHVTSGESFCDILTLARFVAPTVVFLEDLDLFCEDRDSHPQAMGMGELMNQLDGAVENEDIVTIATTNHIDFVEKALRNRPGRFDRVVHIGAMDESCRGKLLSRLLAKAAVAPDDSAHLVRATDGYTGAQIEELANTLYILALDNHNPAEATGGNGRVVVTRALVDAALGEIMVDRRAKAGF